MKNGVKRREEKFKATLQHTKWHKACFWLAYSVGGIDMVLQDDGSIKVIPKANCNLTSPTNRVISRIKNGSTGNRLHLSMRTNDDDQTFVFKTIDYWSEELAKFVVNLISLPKNLDQRLNSFEGQWGIMSIIKANGNNSLTEKFEALFPTIKSEEELFMRMALDGFDINEKDEHDA